MSDNPVDYQVIIIGGGPSGIATALSLLARGVSNCIIEAQATPADKAGEAIPPNAKPLLKKMGIFHLMKDEKHIPYYGNKSCWGTEQLEQEEFIKSVYGHGYLLSRAYFENQLWDHLKAQGGTLFSNSTLKKVERIPNGIKVKVKQGEKTQFLSARYIVDATGRKASVCTQLGVGKQSIDTQFAIICKGHTQTSITHQICIEATEKGWWYLAPQGKNEVILLFFTLKELLPAKEQTMAFLQEAIRSSLHIASLIKELRLDYKTVRIMPTGTSRLPIPYDNDWIAVGDAAFSYDPLSSYGITSALASGYYAGHALASRLENTPNAMQAYRYIMEEAYQSYREQLIIQYGLEKRWSESWYWNNRLNSAPKNIPIKRDEKTIIPTN